jgi:glyoxylase-like metal-dependent hydrolase (beta-lactamase superfamily II)
MKTKLIPPRAGIANVFLIIQGRDILLVDTGSRNQEKRILEAITSRGFDQEHLKYIFLTHTHYDHAGNAAALKEITGAKIIVHESERDFLNDGFMRIPKGTSPLFKAISFMGRNLGLERKIGWYPPAVADITFTQTFDMKPLGFDAEIIHTPGHTVGSSSLVVGDKVIVGDAMFNLGGKFYPGFANDEKTLVKSWKTFAGLEVRWYYPSHGKRIGKAQFLKEADAKGIA